MLEGRHNTVTRICSREDTVLGLSSVEEKTQYRDIFEARHMIATQQCSREDIIPWHDRGKTQYWDSVMFKGRHNTVKRWRQDTWSRLRNVQRKILQCEVQGKTHHPDIFGERHSISWHVWRKTQWRGGGLGSRPQKMYGERLGDGVEYHLMKPTPRR